jgi:hypothetical protein
MEIVVENIRKKPNTLRKKYPDAELIDVTSKAIFPWCKFSPFYPHGNIPIPNSTDAFSKSVEGIWQGLKVFSSHGIDVNSFNNDTMHNIKRTVKTYGSPLGHQYGINSSETLTYVEARKKIFIPSYLYVLKNYLKEEVNLLKEIVKLKKLVLLDYETNCDIENTKKPLSHAFIIKLYIENPENNFEQLPNKPLNNQISLF